MERVMLKRMQPSELTCGAPKLSDATGHGHARRSFWGSLYSVSGSKGDGAR
jgi:hypothetical protein